MAIEGKALACARKIQCYSVREELSNCCAGMVSERNDGLETPNRSKTSPKAEGSWALWMLSATRTSEDTSPACTAFLGARQLRAVMCHVIVKHTLVRFSDPFSHFCLDILHELCLIRHLLLQLRLHVLGHLPF